MIQSLLRKRLRLTEEMAEGDIETLKILRCEYEERTMVHVSHLSSEMRIKYGTRCRLCGDNGHYSNYCGKQWKLQVRTKQPTPISAAKLSEKEPFYEIGRRGERLMYEILRKNGRKVRWINELQEFYIPTDLFYPETEPGKPGRFVEVKTTGERNRFYLSLNELRLLKRSPERYFLFLVNMTSKKNIPY